jgi:hypothetical protein
MSIYSFSVEGYTYRGTWEEGSNGESSPITHVVVTPDGDELSMLPPAQGDFPSERGVRAFIEKYHRRQKLLDWLDKRPKNAISAWAQK